MHFVEVYFYATPNVFSNLFAKVFLWLETKNPAQPLMGLGPCSPGPLPSDKPNWPPRHCQPVSKYSPNGGIDWITPGDIGVGLEMGGPREWRPEEWRGITVPRVCAPWGRVLAQRGRADWGPTVFGSAVLF